jgi:ABC-type transporter Mla subunit MlaD
VTVYYVGNEQWGRHLTPYRTYLQYAGGVEPGTEVLFGGIQVGRVTAVRSWSQDPTKIEILLDVKEGTPVNANSVAKLGTVSLMSSPAISITTGTDDARRLKPSEAIRSEETMSLDDMARKLSGIADNAQTLIAQVQGELKGLSSRADTLLTNLNDATGPTNRENLAGILKQTNKMIADESPKIDRITDQILLASQDADAAIRKAEPLMDHADKTVLNVNTTIDQLRDPIQQDLAQLRSTMEQAKSLIGSIQSVVRGNDDNIRETIDNLRIVSENLTELTDHVNRQPWSLVRIRQEKDRKVPK